MSNIGRGPLAGMNEDTALRIIMEGTATETGESFFKALVENLAKVLDTKGAWVTEYLPDEGRLRSLAFRMGKGWVDEYIYDISGTPCETVVEEKELIHVAENIVELYPDDPDLVPFGAVSYIGVPLLDIDGSVMGHLAVFDSKPLPDESWINSVFRIFASRAAAELQRISAEKELKDREEKLGRLVDSAMDAIIELNNILEVTSMNSAAEKVFGYASDEAVGKDFLSLLCDESAETLPGLIQDLGALPEGKRYLWISGGLIAKRSDGTVFPAEATVSQYELSGKRFYTIILRNIDEHLEAENKIKLLSDEARYLRDEIKELGNFGDVIGDSPALRKVFDDIDQVSRSDATVLILGETGTGKELIARAIHNTSGRCGKPLIKINCGAIPANLIESELFGHEKGAFTGATSKRDGRFTLADGGTIFLDEVGELPLDLQSKLLRVLQEGEYEPVGSSRTKKVDVRVIAATNRDLYKASQDGKFRKDLYYRLYVFPINVPPLRERGDDIFKLAGVFAKKVADRIGIRIESLTSDQMSLLSNHDWPGNVRELQNVIELAVITSTEGVLNLARALPGNADSNPEKRKAQDIRVNEVHTMKELHEIERHNIILALDMCEWRVSGQRGAAKLLGIPPSTLSSRIKALGIKKQS